MKVMRGCARAAVGLVVALGAVGCSGGGSAEVTPLPSTSAGSPVVGSTAVVVTAAVVGSASASDVTVDVTDVTPTEGSTPPSSEPATTDDSTTTSTVLPDGFVGLSPDGPWQLVDSAPGVDTPGLVYELMPKLWAFLPTEEVPDDGNLFVPLPDDIPIIEAYLQAKLVLYRSAGQSPMNFDDDGWIQWYADAGATYRAALSDRNASGQTLDLDLGVVQRPYVLGDGRTASSAVVMDCAVDGAVWRLPDGSLGSGSVQGVVDSGLIATLTLRDGRWLVDHIADEDMACV